MKKLLSAIALLLFTAALAGCALKRAGKRPVPTVPVQVVRGDCLLKLEKTEATVCRHKGNEPWKCEPLRMDYACSTYIEEPKAK